MATEPCARCGDERGDCELRARDMAQFGDKASRVAASIVVACGLRSVANAIKWRS